MFVKISPEAPTRDPLIIRALLLIKNPVAAAAIPEYEFRREITTGISAPPIGIVRPIPKINARATTTKNALINPE
jgi:hypothetical protein